MLYSLYEAQTLAATSVRQSAALARTFFQSTGAVWGYPWDWSSWPVNKAAANGLEFIEYMTRPFGKPEYGIDSVIIDKSPVPVIEEIVLTKPFCELRSFRRAGSDGAQDKALIVAPMSGHYASLVRDTIQRMLEHYDVYVTDWVDAAQVPMAEGQFDLDDYIDYCREFMQLLGPDVHVLSVCQPGPAVLAAVSLMSEDDDPCTPKSMVYFASPIDPRKNPKDPNKFAHMHSINWFEKNAICEVPQSRPGAGRAVYPGFLQLSHFLNMNLDRHCTAYADYYHNLIMDNSEEAQSHEYFYNNYNAVMDMTAEFYLQTIERVFQKAEIANNTMMHRGRAINPAAITKTRLMTIEGEKDDITGLGQTRAAHDLCTGLAENNRLHLQQTGAGHYGVFSGRLWREEIAPRIVEFVASGESETCQ